MPSNVSEAGYPPHQDAASPQKRMATKIGVMGGASDIALPESMAKAHSLSSTANKDLSKAWLPSSQLDSAGRFALRGMKKRCHSVPRKVVNRTLVLPGSTAKGASPPIG